MSSNYAVLGVAMAAAGVLTDMFGARAIWIAAGSVYLFGSFVALLMTRWLPIGQESELDAIEASSESAVAALENGDAGALEHEQLSNGNQTNGLERIAALLEEIEARHELEGRGLFSSRRAATRAPISGGRYYPFGGPICGRGAPHSSMNSRMCSARAT
jgi:hypothetical protein